MVCHTPLDYLPFWCRVSSSSLIVCRYGDVAFRVLIQNEVKRQNSGVIVDLNQAAIVSD